MSRPKKDSSPANRSKRVTMQDIADAAGVHLMTVSNSLNNVRSVAPETREKVLRIARELNYIPNDVARALAGGRTGMIAIICGHLNEHYYASMVHLLKVHLDREGYKVTILRRPLQVHEFVGATGGLAIDGAIAIDILIPEEDFTSAPAVPCVYVGTYEPKSLDYVTVELRDNVREALEIMYESGKRRIAYVINAPHLAWRSEVRAGTYLDFMEEKGESPEIIDLFRDGLHDDLITNLRPQLKMHIEQHGYPQAMMCLNDEIAMSAYRVLRDLGLRIPEDVALVGCDGHLHMEYFDPPLSTIKQPLEEMCATAWAFLKERMAHPEAPQQQAHLQGTLVVTESLAPAKTKVERA